MFFSTFFLKKIDYKRWHFLSLKSWQSNVQARALKVQISPGAQHLHPEVLSSKSSEFHIAKTCNWLFSRKNVEKNINFPSKNWLFTESIYNQKSCFLLKTGGVPNKPSVGDRFWNKNDHSCTSLEKVTDSQKPSFFNSQKSCFFHQKRCFGSDFGWICTFE